MDARCERCGAVLPDADMRALIAAEEEDRRRGFHSMQLLCMVCYSVVSSPFYDKADDELWYVDM